MTRSTVALLMMIGCTEPSGYGGKAVSDSGMLLTNTVGTNTNTNTTNTGTSTGNTTQTGTTGSTTTATGTGGSTGTGGTTGTGTATGTATGTGGTTSFVPTCVVVLPADVIVVDSTMNDATDGASYWVCRGEILSYSGTDAHIFVENSADLVLNGQDSFVWLQSNSDLAAFDSPNTVLHEPGAAINDTTGLNLLTLCPEILYDYSLAPSPGCN